MSSLGLQAGRSSLRRLLPLILGLAMLSGCSMSRSVGEDVGAGATSATVSPNAASSPMHGTALPPGAASPVGNATAAAGPAAGARSVGDASTPETQTGWTVLGPGMERRAWRPDRSGAGRLVAYRLDPGRLRFEVGYRPENPPTLTEWQADTGADLVVNGGYFDERFRATALVVAGGESHGRSYLGFGGMFSVGPGGPDVRWLRDRPYALDEAITAAVQSFPVLIADGVVVWTKDSPLRARRTVVAEDRAGSIHFVIAPDDSYTLRELALTLAESDLELRTALNLDGGGSTGVALGEPPEAIPAFTPLPLVILVHAEAAATGP